MAYWTVLGGFDGARAFVLPAGCRLQGVDVEVRFEGLGV